MTIRRYQTTCYNSQPDSQICDISAVHVVIALFNNVANIADPARRRWGRNPWCGGGVLPGLGHRGVGLAIPGTVGRCTQSVSDVLWRG